MLGEVEQLSPSGQRLRALCMVHLADLDAAAPPSNDQTTDETEIVNSNLGSYCAAQSILLQQVIVYYLNVIANQFHFLQLPEILELVTQLIVSSILQYT